MRLLLVLLHGWAVANPSDELSEIYRAKNLKDAMVSVASRHPADPVFLRRLNVFLAQAHDDFSKQKWPRDISHVNIAFRKAFKNDELNSQIIIMIFCKNACQPMKIEWNGQSRIPKSAEASSTLRMIEPLPFKPFQKLKIRFLWTDTTPIELTLLTPYMEKVDLTKPCPRSHFIRVNAQDITETVALDLAGAHPLWQSFQSVPSIPAHLLQPYFLMKSCINDLHLGTVSLQLYPSTIVRVP